MKYFSVIVLALGLGVLSGCASLSNKSDEDVVKERAQARYDALIKGNIRDAWQFTAPTYRQRVSAEGYQSVMGGVGNWKKAEVSSVNCEEDRCEVIGMITYNIARLNMENVIPLTDVWIKTDGKWWVYHRR
jgi:hypothetical protein